MAVTSGRSRGGVSFNFNMPSLVMLLACVFGLLATVTAGDPEVKLSRFKNMPAKLFYFDDSTVVLMHDLTESAVFRSSDEGKTWARIEDVENVLRLVEHPHAKKVAFLLGSEKKHYVTYNRGETWQSFTTPTEITANAEPLQFHATKHDWIIFQGTKCERTSHFPWGGRRCTDHAYYTTDAFRSEPKMLLESVRSCTFARTQKVVDTSENMVLCIAFESESSDGHRVSDARLYRSDTWFEKKEYVDLGIGKRAVGVVGLGIVSKFMVVAIKSSTSLDKRADNTMMLFVSTDAVNWRQAQFPHSALPSLVENSYTIVESTTDSIAVDVLTSPQSYIGTLFVSSDQGTYFVESLPDTNRNENGIVDFEQLTNLQGVGIANVVRNRERVVTGAERKQLSSRITFDDGSNWSRIRAPKTKMDGSPWGCDTSDLEKCSLHLTSVTTPHNLGTLFSSTAPGFVMAVGSVGEYLLPYNDCDTFLSTDAGVTWKMAQEGAHKYEFGDQGSVLVIADDEEFTDHVHYSYDGGSNWKKLDLGVTCRVIVLTTIPDSTSQKFLIIGQVPRKDSKDGRVITVFLDFATLQTRKCEAKDFENWYARGGEGQECIMGHKQWYKRRKLDADCYVGDKFEDPVGHEEDCKCTEKDFECDFNFVRQSGDCVAVGPEVVPPGVCKNKDDTYEGSSGYRKIPGNTCKGGIDKAAKIKKPCTAARPDGGNVTHVIHDFDSIVDFHSYFSDSQSILMQLTDDTVWQSSNDGYSWVQPVKDKRFLDVLMHPYDNERAYLIGSDRKIHYTKDTGASWATMDTPMDPNTLSIPLLDFHPTRSDWLIYTGSVGCSSTISNTCHATAWYSTDHGRSWHQVESYVRNCQWARDSYLKIDERMILCESYTRKQGSQRSGEDNPLKLVAGRNYYRDKQVLFESIAGYTTFSEYLLVAELDQNKHSLALQVSLNGVNYAEAQFPPGMRVENHAYTILESNTHSVFLHMTMNSVQNREWGSIFKSNWNGTYYGLSIEHVNRNTRGYVDFEKMTGLDGIAVVNVVSNPGRTEVTGRKKLQSRITHNDGGKWSMLTPPARDSLGQKYECSDVRCSLHIHGYSERRDPKATFSSPSAVGFMLGVGNVGEELAPYTDSDLFLTRDGGFTWEEVHKDAHMWEYGDSGSIIVIVNDEEPVDHVLYSKDEGLSWKSYSFGEKLRVKSIQTVPQDTSRRFILIAQRPNAHAKDVIVHLDFSAIHQRQCKLDLNDPNNDDFELWSPSEERDEKCLFGRQTQYHRRVRKADCYIGKQVEALKTIVKNCTCTAADFECEFNHVRNENGQCVLVPGATALSLDTMEEQCVGDANVWYERTAYRMMAYSSCEGGERLDRGKEHPCPGLVRAGSMGALFWASIIILPFALAGLAGWWFVAKGSRTGAIRLGEHRAYGSNATNALQTLASVPYFILGVVSSLWTAIEMRVPFVQDLFRRRSPYRAVPIDDDAELLGEYEDD